MQLFKFVHHCCSRFLTMNKTLLLLLLILCALCSTSFAQVIKNYSAEWKKVDELIQKKNLPKSALEEVKKIYALAKKRKTGCTNYKGPCIYDRPATREP